MEIKESRFFVRKMNIFNFLLLWDQYDIIKMNAKRERDFWKRENTLFWVQAKLTDG